MALPLPLSFLKNKKQTLQGKFRLEAAKLIQPNIQEEPILVFVVCHHPILMHMPCYKQLSLYTQSKESLHTAEDGQFHSIIKIKNNWTE